MSVARTFGKAVVAPFDTAAISHSIATDGSFLLVPSPTSGGAVVVTLADAPTPAPFIFRMVTEGAPGSTTVSVQNATATTLATIAVGQIGWIELCWLPDGWHPVAWSDTVTVWP